MKTAEITWGDISRAFTKQYPHISNLMDDYRPYRANTIWVWLKDGVSIIVEYQQEGGACSIRTPSPGEDWADPATGLKGCWHCRNIEAHHIEYVIAVKAKGGTPMNTPVDCPYHHCPACGRKLEEKK